MEYILLLGVLLYLSEYDSVIIQKGGAGNAVIIGGVLAFFVILVVVGIFVFGRMGPTPTPVDDDDE